ncbi:phosphate ABC transporter permease subunit PstC [Microbacterium sp. VKM Ac-2923]|uniref:phosphate ABC transporter permease subunit PstC n=1 Tax=Microbacterium sp. VKM Ac-2923 TaxID=2929476 RepID=UPI001FB2C3F4|nr:phosphate ABC transporter permease subunit PstC [Microbacterium sp. VKM Ac-2923]MCJ1708680.1 phosphate ABC transporter permease subunit PstC [Microbacterium sp. VKM Ac-2923]
MTDTVAEQETSPVSPTPPRASIVGKRRVGDTVFLGLSTTAAVSIMIILAGVAIFLIIRGLPAITGNWAEGDLAGYQSRTGNWANFWEYVGPLLFGSIWAAFIAMIIGTPVAIGIALFISHYAPRRIAGALGYVVDLLAAVPSIVFGLWGIIVMRPLLLPVGEFLNQYLGWIPLFNGPVSSTGSTMLTGGVVLAVMILPIVTSITREIFLQTPRLHEEAALALGATRWEMIRLSVFPYARSGMVSATLLGLGRALGETMAIALIISPSLIYSVLMLTDGYNSQTIAANIALNFPIATDLQRSALIGTGLMLFVVSLAVNMFARYIIGATGPGAKGRKKGKRS